MASIRNMANCIGVTGKFSIIKDFFGYARRPPRSISLLKQVRLLMIRHIDLNLIHVGSDHIIYNEAIFPGTNLDIAAAIQTARDTYAQVNMGIGRIRYYDIPLSSTRGREIIDSDASARALTREWTVRNDAFDVFLVTFYNSNATLGLSARPGLCDKDSSCVMTGSVVSLESAGVTGDTLAHEVGHYLGLDIESAHSPDPTNLMYFSVPNNKNLNADQGSTMAVHCFVKGPCS